LVDQMKAQKSICPLSSRQKEKILLFRKRTIEISILMENMHLEFYLTRFVRFEIWSLRNVLYEKDFGSLMRAPVKINFLEIR